MIRHSPWPAAALLAAAVLWAPLPFGSVTAWAATLVEVAAFCALALALATAPRARVFAPAAAPAAALAALALLGFAQAFVWPPAVVAALSPEHAELVAGAGRLLAATGAPTPPLTLTVAPGATRAAAFAWLSLGAALLAAAAVGRRRACRRLLAAAVGLAALFELVYGARGWFAQAHEIWGVAVEGPPNRLRGTFVNPNHLAAFLEMALAVAFAASWWALRRARFVLRVEERLALVAPPLVLWLTLFVTLAFTGSRAGLVAAVIGVVVQGLLLAAARRSWWPAAAVAALALAGFLAVATTSLREGVRRWVEGGSGAVAFRFEADAHALDLWRRFPWTGSGLGTFREAFPLVQPETLGGTWWHLHNDPLELLVTTGVAGVLVLAAGLVALLRRLWRVLTTGVRSEDRAAALAALGALFAVGFHELVDYGLTMPANALVLVVLLGAATAPSHRRASAPDKAAGEP